MQSLIEVNADLNLFDNQHLTPLCIAIRQGYNRCIHMLLQAGANVNIGGGLFGSPLHMAVSKSEVWLVEMMLNRGADPNSIDHQGNTPLHQVMKVFSKNVARSGLFIEMLVKYGARTDLKNNDMWAPLHLAAKSGSNKAIEWVLGFNQRLRQRLQQSVEQKKQANEEQKKNQKNEYVKQESEHMYFDINQLGGAQCHTPLHLASFSNNYQIVELLVDSRFCDIFTRNSQGKTARQLCQKKLALHKVFKRAQAKFKHKRIWGKSGAASVSQNSLLEFAEVLKLTGKASSVMVSRHKKHNLDSEGKFAIRYSSVTHKRPSKQNFESLVPQLSQRLSINNQFPLSSSSSQSSSKFKPSSSNLQKLKNQRQLKYLLNSPQFKIFPRQQLLNCFKDIKGFQNYHRLDQAYLFISQKKRAMYAFYLSNKQQNPQYKPPPTPSKQLQNKQIIKYLPSQSTRRKQSQSITPKPILSHTQQHIQQSYSSSSSSEIVLQDSGIDHNMNQQKRQHSDTRREMYFIREESNARTKDQNTIAHFIANPFYLKDKFYDTNSKPIECYQALIMFQKNFHSSDERWQQSFKDLLKNIDKIPHQQIRCDLIHRASLFGYADYIKSNGMVLIQRQEDDQEEKLQKVQNCEKQGGYRKIRKVNVENLFQSEIYNYEKNSNTNNNSAGVNTRFAYSDKKNKRPNLQNLNQYMKKANMKETNQQTQGQVLLHFYTAYELTNAANTAFEINAFNQRMTLMQTRHINSSLSIFNKSKNLLKVSAKPSGPMMKSQGKIQPIQGNQEFPHNGRQPQQASLHNRSPFVYNNKVFGNNSSGASSTRFANLLTPSSEIKVVNSNKQQLLGQKSLANQTPKMGRAAMYFGAEQQDQLNKQDTVEKNYTLPQNEDISVLEAHPFRRKLHKNGSSSSVIVEQRKFNQQSQNDLIGNQANMLTGPIENIGAYRDGDDDSVRTPSPGQDSVRSFINNIIQQQNTPEIVKLQNFTFKRDNLLLQTSPNLNIQSRTCEKYKKSSPRIAFQSQNRINKHEDRKQEVKYMYNEKNEAPLANSSRNLEMRDSMMQMMMMTTQNRFLAPMTPPTFFTKIRKDNKSQYSKNFNTTKKQSSKLNSAGTSQSNGANSLQSINFGQLKSKNNTKLLNHMARPRFQNSSKFYVMKDGFGSPAIRVKKVLNIEEEPSVQSENLTENGSVFNDDSN